MSYVHLASALLVTASLFSSLLCAADGDVIITGEKKRWHNVILTLDGPASSETAGPLNANGTGTPNPFEDYRFDVTFTNGALTYRVPGYFAADGNAAETSSSSGNKWRAHLCPDLTGTWKYTISFRKGKNVAQNGGGVVVPAYNGLSGTFVVAETDKSSDLHDFRGKGRLAYVGQRYLQFAGDKSYFIKTGADSPETFLAAKDIDGTVMGAGGSSLKDWSNHVIDFRSGNDPSWQGGKGKGIIGAINYLSGKGANSFSFLTYNVGGDGRNVWPMISDKEQDRTRYDCSKLDQWEIIFSHGDRMGMYLHFKTQEAENDAETAANSNTGQNVALDGGKIGLQRKLYYRELIARFGHHLALNWNLGEENDGIHLPAQTDAQRIEMAQYFFDNDPYHHLIVVHNAGGRETKTWIPLLGNQSKLSGASMQIGNPNNIHATTLFNINAATQANKQWIIACDEQGAPSTGIPEDGKNIGGITQDTTRNIVLWGNLMAGGAGIESYFGYQTSQSDLSCQDYRTRDMWWNYCRIAKGFFQDHVPFEKTLNANSLIGNTANDNSKYCLAQKGEVYAIYLANGGTTSLNLASAPGSFTVRWFDPRNGGGLKNGSVIRVNGGASVALGNPPELQTQDWVILVEKEVVGVNASPTVNAGVDQNINITGMATLNGTVSDDGLPSGSSVTTTWSKVSGPGAVTFTNARLIDTSARFSVAGTYVLRLTATDGAKQAADDVQVMVAAGNIAPTATITSPKASDTVFVTQSLVVTAYADDADGGIAQVDLLVDGNFVRSEKVVPYMWTLSPLAEGEHTLQVKAVDNLGAKTLSQIVRVTVRKAFTAQVNFQPDGTPVQAGWLVDIGLVYGPRGTGFVYGWDADVTAQTRDRNSTESRDQMHDTLIRIQKDLTPDAVWEIAVPNATYDVRLIAGDPLFIGVALQKITVEGVVAANFTPTTTTRWSDRTVSVVVSDGKLTVRHAPESVNAKICGIDIREIVPATM